MAQDRVTAFDDGEQLVIAHSYLICLDTLADSRPGSHRTANRTWRLLSNHFFELKVVALRRVSARRSPARYMRSAPANPDQPGTLFMNIWYPGDRASQRWSTT